MAIFSKLFGDAMSHIIRWNAGKKRKSIFELFSKQKIESKFVLFSIGQTLLKMDLIYVSSSLHQFKKKYIICKPEGKNFYSACFIPCLNEFPKIILQNLSHVSIKAIHDTKRSTISVNNIPNDIAHWGEIISILVISH